MDESSFVTLVVLLRLTGKIRSSFDISHKHQWQYGRCLMRPVGLTKWEQDLENIFFWIKFCRQLRWDCSPKEWIGTANCLQLSPITVEMPRNRKQLSVIGTLWSWNDTSIVYFYGDKIFSAQVYWLSLTWWKVCPNRMWPVATTCGCTTCWLDASELLELLQFWSWDWIPRTNDKCGKFSFRNFLAVQ